MTTIPQCTLGEHFDQIIRALPPTLRPATIEHYRFCAGWFVRYIHSNYTELRTLAELKRNPHILGWLQSLSERNPPFTIGTRLQIVTGVRHLLKNLADNGHRVDQNMILPQDTQRQPPTPVCPEVDNPLARLLKHQLHALSATLRPNTLAYYRVHANGFVHYLHRNYPEVEAPAQLQRNPHILAWLRGLAERNPPLANGSRLQIIFCVRRLLNDLADNGCPVAEGLILPQDFPPQDLYLPKPVSPEVDDLLTRELRKTDDLLSNILLLIRATGMRVGECLNLKKDCLHHLGGDDWALHVPLGKLHNERLVPVDAEARKILDRILCILGSCVSTDPATPLFTLNGRKLSYERMRNALKNVSQRADCQPVRPHQLRHTYATMMLRSGISLPALREILGHRNIRMTMRYVQVTQADLQREYLLARQKMETSHPIPQLPGLTWTKSTSTISGICNNLDAIRHQLEMYRRQLNDQSRGRKLQRMMRSLIRLRRSLATFLKQQSGTD
ncbi:MAG TPA: site-specific integrase [Syntrophobacteraceae bacterium]|nr:site-specific integrase [Syntrophobacteraceae bacterium]